MSLNLVQLAADNFQRANENPLSDGGLWAAPTGGASGLQIVSELCQSAASSSSDYAGQYFNGAPLPEDQYASLTLATFENGSDASVAMYVRAAGSNQGQPISGYSLVLAISAQDSGVGANFGVSGGGIPFNSTLVTFSEGDVWTLAAVGNTLYVIRNGTVVASQVDSEAAYASGDVFYNLQYFFGAQDSLQLSNAAIGFIPVISGNAGVAGATVSWSGTSSGSTTADGSGNFTISGLAQGSYTITPSLTDYIFSPASASESLSTSSITGVDFTAYVNAFNISGNAGVAGALISYSGTASGSVVAGSGGAYTITGLPAGSYTITPSLYGYTFSPTSQNETISTENITGVNFTATQVFIPSTRFTFIERPSTTPGATVYDVVDSGSGKKVGQIFFDTIVAQAWSFNLQDNQPYIAAGSNDTTDIENFATSLAVPTGVTPVQPGPTPSTRFQFTPVVRQSGQMPLAYLVSDGPSISFGSVAQVVWDGVFDRFCFLLTNASAEISSPADVACVTSFVNSLAKISPNVIQL